MPLFVGHGERRHRIAGPRGRLAGVIGLESPDHAIHGFLIAGEQIAGRIAEGLKPLVQGCIHVAAIQEGLLEGVEGRNCHALAPLPPAQLKSTVRRGTRYEEPRSDNVVRGEGGELARCSDQTACELGIILTFRGCARTRCFSFRYGPLLRTRSNSNRLLCRSSISISAEARKAPGSDAGALGKRRWGKR
jgi:hypothetical protein